MKVVFSGGGTGGHIYPALAIKEILKEKYDFEAGYIGVTGGLEEKIVEREKDIRFMGVEALGMPRKLSLKWFSFPFVNLRGIYKAYKHLKEFKPDLAITTGGFVAFPVLAAARILNIPVVMHEQNAAMGVTNKLFVSSAKKVFLTYESAYKPDNERIIVTGNPVRKAFLNQNKADTNKLFEKNNEENFTVAVVGGSRGALSLNKLCIELAQTWLREHKNVKLIHISGERDYEMVNNAVKNPPANYTLLPYHHEMKEIFDTSDLLISRAGATILAEIAVCKKPAILVPYPYATDNHQEKNAKVLEDQNAAKMLRDNQLTLDTVSKLLIELQNKEKLKAMSAAMANSRPANVETQIRDQLAPFFPQTPK